MCICIYKHLIQVVFGGGVGLTPPELRSEAAPKVAGDRREPVLLSSLSLL